jgi:hypothetical protein
MIDRIIDRVFKRLSATYGAEWERSISAAPIADIRTVWAHEMGRYERSLGRIAWALDNLPTSCPNVIIFRSLCAAAPVQEAPHKAIEYKPSEIAPEVKRAVITGLRDGTASIDKRAWAHALKARHEAGKAFNMNQVRCYKNALGLHPGGVQL